VDRLIAFQKVEPIVEIEDDKLWSAESEWQQMADTIEKVYPIREGMMSSVDCLYVYTKQYK